MKVYEKPKLMVLSVSANDALCGNCDHGTRFDPVFQGIAKDYGNFDDLLEPSDGLFAGEADSCEIEADYDAFCKFASVESGKTKIFTS